MTERLIEVDVELDPTYTSRRTQYLPVVVRSPAVPRVGDVLVTGPDMDEWSVTRVSWVTDPDKPDTVRPSVRVSASDLDVREWRVWAGGSDADNCAVSWTTDDEAEAHERLQWMDGSHGRGIAVRAVTRGPWVPVEHEHSTVWADADDDATAAGAR